MKFNSCKIGLSLIWLAGLTILLHAVIPHHHHYSPNQSCHSNEQNKTALNVNHTHSCNAFNVLIDRENKNPVRKISSNIDTPINLSNRVTPTAFLKETKTDFYFIFKDRLVTSLLLRSCQPVRGSPLS